MKAIKILIVFALAIGVITLNSCKKKDVKPTATITADVNGTATTFNVHAIAATGTLEGVTFTTITGSASDGTSISITLNGALTAGKTFDTSGSPDVIPLIAIEAGDNSFLNDDSSITNPVSVTINAVSSTAVSGTFKGDLTSLTIGNVQPQTKSVTNGKFSVSF